MMKKVKLKLRIWFSLIYYSGSIIVNKISEVWSVGHVVISIFLVDCLKSTHEFPSKLLLHPSVPPVFTELLEPALILKPLLYGFCKFFNIPFGPATARAILL